MQPYNIDIDQKVPERWETRVLAIEGMTCEKCVETLTKALKRVNGIKEARVDRQNAQATITFDTTKTDMPAIHDAILRSGYKPTRESSPVIEREPAYWPPLGTTSRHMQARYTTAVSP